MTVLGPGENPLAPGEKAIRIDMNRALNEPGYLMDILGIREEDLPEGLRPGSIVPERTAPRTDLFDDI